MSASAAPPPPDYLARLNPEQREAVETLDGPLLVLAGAGTGKTRVLTTRFAHLLMTGRAWPGQVLAVTFTNKAAREMRERVSSILGRPAEGLWLGTFHALCARMLRRHAELVGLTSSFTILDTDDQMRLLKQVMEAAGVDLKRWPAPGMMAAIQRWKDRGLAPDGVTPAEDTEYANGRARALYAAYQSRLRDLNACDFGDLMLHVVGILRGHPEVLADWHRRFRYILVDEYQDTNLVQYLWLRLLAQGHKNICCVGDDDQSIYSWRGAEIENILRFERDFAGAKVVRLESNYRSTRPILAAASGLIAHNTGRLGKTLRSGRNDAEGEKVRVVSLWDSVEEARMVGERIEAARLVEGNDLRSKPRQALAELLRGFARWREALGREGHVLVAATLLDESGYTDMWKADKSPEAPGRLENLKEFIRALGEFDTLGGFLEHVALVMENDENAEGDRLSLMTLHAAKGLEFDMVFLPGWEEGLFPHQRALDESGEKGLEEERRLAYVGLTRARKLAVVSSAANRQIYGNWSSAIPSRFLDELPPDQVQREGSAAVTRGRAVEIPSVFTGMGGLAARRRVIDQGAWEVQERPAPSDALSVGQRVFHQKFGYGEVLAVDDNKLDVEFATGRKRVLSSFVEKA